MATEDSTARKAPDELEERLRSHARAFDSLLSLIPAKLYYGEDVSDQWKRKKQTPEQKRAAKRAKLDPDNWKSAKDVMDERAAAAKRKREEEEEDVDIPIDGIEAEKPKAEQIEETLKPKRRKTQATDQEQPLPAKAVEDEEEAKRTKIAEKRKAKRAEKKAKKEKMKEKSSQRKERQREQKTQQSKTDKPQGNRELNKEIATDKGSDEDDEDEEEDEDEVMFDVPDLDEEALNKLHAENDVKESESVSISENDEPAIFSPIPESASSSISSIQQPPETSVEPKVTKPVLEEPAAGENVPKNDAIHPLQVDSAQSARERLEAAINRFRADRKAVGSDGRPARNRQELLAQRRQKEEERRTAKKEQRRKEKEEEAKRQEEEIARRFSPGGSGSLLASPRSPQIDGPGNNFSFGNVAFDDGTQLDASLSALQEQRRKKGPSDAATALKAAQGKAARLSGLDEQKRLDIQQKDLWMNAKKKAHGERVKDDTSLLKKALKRQDSQKKKSEKEWGERKEGLQRAQDVKQKKRTENIQKRKDEKSGQGKKGGKPGKVRRPGFEGSFRAGGGKKK